MVIQIGVCNQGRVNVLIQGIGIKVENQDNEWVSKLRFKFLTKLEVKVKSMIQVKGWIKTKMFQIRV